MVDAFLGKKYKLASSENFDEFMKTLGKFPLFYFFWVEEQILCMCTFRRPDDLVYFKYLVNKYSNSYLKLDEDESTSFIQNYRMLKYLPSINVYKMHIPTQNVQIPC